MPYTAMLQGVPGIQASADGFKVKTQRTSSACAACLLGQPGVIGTRHLPKSLTGGGRDASSWSNRKLCREQFLF